MTNRSATASLFTVVGMPKFVWSWQFLAFNQMDAKFSGQTKLSWAPAANQK